MKTGYIGPRRKDLVLTAPVLVLSILQSGMILDSVTIQLLILSLLLLSTAEKKQSKLSYSMRCIKVEVNLKLNLIFFLPIHVLCLL